VLYPTRGGARVIVPTDDLTDAKEALRAFDLVGAPVMRSEVLEVSVASAPRGDALPGIARITESLPGAHRAVAIFLADAFSRAAGRGLGSPPKDAPLPGGGSLVRVAPLSEHFHVPDLAVRRLVSRHGALTDHVLGRTLAAPAERALVCSCEAILECEIRHACSVEGSKSIDDVARRTTLGAGACHGLDCLHRAAQIVRSETGADASTTRRRVDELVRVRFDARAPFLRPSDLGREELALGRLVAAGAAAREEP
jgi:glycerol-3-phosphate dehydrogenase